MPGANRNVNKIAVAFFPHLMCARFYNLLPRGTAGQTKTRDQNQKSLFHEIKGTLKIAFYFIWQAVILVCYEDV